MGFMSRDNVAGKEKEACLRELMSSSLPVNASASALKRFIQVLSMLAATSRWCATTHSARGCTAGLSACSTFHVSPSANLHN